MLFINRRLAVSVIVCALSYFLYKDSSKMVTFSAKIALHHQVRRYFSYNTFFIALRFLKRYNEYGIKYLLITCNALCGERRRLYGFGRKTV